MKIHFLLTSLLLMAASQLATAKPLDAPARIYFPDGSHEDVLITAYKNGTTTYKLNERDLNRTRKAAKDIEAIYFKEVPIFQEAMALFKSRKYAEAKKKFIECAAAYKAVDTAPNNFATQASYYSLECSRRSFDLDTLRSDMEKFRKDALTRPHQLQQLEVNAFWEAVRLKEWTRLNRLANDWRNRKVTGSQRAQIAFCHGRAYEELAKKDPKLVTKALNSYNMALSADFTTSTEIVVASASNALRIYTSDPKVKLAMKLWKTEDANEGGVGHQRLLEANAMVKLYKQGGFDKVKALSSDAKELFKFEDTADAN